MLFLDYFIVALVCGLASAFVAGKKGKSRYLWFFIGLIGSVFAILVITLKTKKDG